MKRLLSLLLSLLLLSAPLQAAAFDAPSDENPSSVWGDIENGEYDLTERETHQLEIYAERAFAAPDNFADPLEDEDVLGVLDKNYPDEVPTCANVYEAAEFMLYNALSNNFSSQNDGKYYCTVRFKAAWGADKSQAQALASILTKLVYTYYVHWFGYGVSFSGDIVTFSVVLQDAQAVREESGEAADAAEEIRGSLPSGYTPEAFMRAANQYLCDNVTYDLTAPGDGQYAHYAFADGVGVCAAYANAFALICYNEGLDVAGYTGQHGENHRWNVFFGDGPSQFGENPPKLIDVTWDDNGVPEKYFLKTYAELGDAFMSARKWDAKLDVFTEYLHTGKVGYAPVPDKGVAVGDDGLAFIDLSRYGEETMENVPEVAAYSLDGGNKWKAGAIRDLSKLLSKPTKLAVTDAFDRKTKKPAAGATVVFFPKIAARPAANPNKYKVNYILTDDPSGKSGSMWTLAPAGASSVPADIESYAFAEMYGRETGSFYTIDPTGEFVSDDEKQKLAVCKIAVTDRENGTYIPSGKRFKVTVSAMAKPPRAKADYKKETVKLKRGQTLFVGSPTSLKYDLPVTVPGGQYTVSPGEKITAEGNLTVDISECLDAGATKILIWNGASEKKPMSDWTVLPLAPRAAAADMELPSGGKLNAKFEVFNGVSWGKLPKNASGEYELRLKATAKQGSDGAVTGAAAGFAGKLTVFP